MRNFLMALGCGLVFVSCVANTPQVRIQQNARKFSALGATHQALVQRGQISRGMTRDAVFLAWGRPSGVFEGSSGGKLSERWDYTGTRPVPMTRFDASYGYGAYGPYGLDYSMIGFGLGPEIAYIPYRKGSVWFVNQLVDSWERAR